MEHKKLVEILQHCRPAGGWVVTGEKVSYDDGVLPLTDKEMLDGAAVVDSLKYREPRMKAYPPLQEFADAFVHLQNGDATQMNAYVEKCNAVKAQFPKPE